MDTNQIIESPGNYGYRSRVELKVTRKSGKNDPFLGFYHENSHKIVPVARCIVCNDRINELIEAINFYIPVVLKQNCDSIKISYSKSSDKLLLRAEGKGLYKNTMQLVYDELKKYVKGLAGITFGYGNKKSSIGQEYLSETINDIKYRVNSDSFFQINNLLHEELVKKVLSLFNPKKTENILDLYCGVGTFALQFAKKSKTIIGIEENINAVNDAKFNAKSNKISNTSFISGDVSVLLPKLLSDDANKIKSVFLNPPRTGCSTEVKKEISISKIDKIVYLSCNPSTLARDLSYFIKKGFKLEMIQPIDLFPQTMHIETIATLKRDS